MQMNELVSLLELRLRAEARNETLTIVTHGQPICVTTAEDQILWMIEEKTDYLCCEAVIPWGDDGGREHRIFVGAPPTYPEDHHDQKDFLEWLEREPIAMYISKWEKIGGVDSNMLAQAQANAQVKGMCLLAGIPRNQSQQDLWVELLAILKE